MMPVKIPMDTLIKKRKENRIDKSGKQLIRKYGISNSTIINYTNDISTKSESGLQKIKDDTEIPISYKNKILKYFKQK